MDKKLCLLSKSPIFLRKKGILQIHSILIDGKLNKRNTQNRFTDIRQIIIRIKNSDWCFKCLRGFLHIQMKNVRTI